MPAKKYQVTAAHAVKFTRYIGKWQGVLSLGTWRVTVSPIRTKSLVMAEVYKCDLEQRSATIRLASEWNYPVTDEELEKLAIHELLHILLRPFKTWAMEPGANEDDISSEEHGVINVFETYLYNTRSRR